MVTRLRTLPCLRKGGEKREFVRKNIFLSLELDTEHKIESHYPISEATTDYLNASSNIRDNRSRIVTTTFRCRYKKINLFLRNKMIQSIVSDNIFGCV
jgi:hypothetical protein